MRGKPRGTAWQAGRYRITPAHAGKTPAGGLPRSRTSDHPRACGENALKSVARLPFLGSPPRMRGKQAPCALSVLCHRITPAHAGKTGRAGALAPAAADHPRACGENPCVCWACALSCGSPPRMRGKPLGVNPVWLMGRITPAHAGKTKILSSPPSGKTDHPRACGENKHLLESEGQYSGSPPRMRGKPVEKRRMEQARRITPAHAGKTAAALLMPCHSPDHPRACGENVCRDVEAGLGVGSPPRMRGKRRWDSTRDTEQRITPAHAGKTCR